MRRPSTLQQLSPWHRSHGLADGAVVVPSFGVPTDDAAFDVLSGLFPGREVVLVPSREILLGGGNIHCITQQQPAGRTR